MCIHDYQRAIQSAHVYCLLHKRFYTKVVRENNKFMFILCFHSNYVKHKNDVTLRKTYNSKLKYKCWSKDINIIEVKLSILLNAWSKRLLGTLILYERALHIKRVKKGSYRSVLYVRNQPSYFFYDFGIYNFITFKIWKVNEIAVKICL